jgi:hypothetical protein
LLFRGLMRINTIEPGSCRGEQVVDRHLSFADAAPTGCAWPLSS